MPLDYAERYDIAGQASDNILGTTKSFFVSTAADIISTLWNSIPFTENVKTSDILEKVDQDSLAFYNENQDTVQTASLIGGAFIPGGVTLKLLGRARAGVSSVGYIENGILGAAKGAVTGQRQKYLATEIERVFAESGAATSQYKQLVRQLYASNIGKEFVDNAIIEAAIVGAMNAHPYMEDYLKDPVTNFAIGMGIGGILGTAIAIPSTRRQLTDLLAPTQEGAISRIFERGYQPIAKKDHSLSSAAMTQRHSANLQILDDVILNPEEKGITRQLADSIRKAEAAQMEEVLLHAAPAIKGSKKEINKEMRDTVFGILNNPRFVGIDKIRFYDLSKVSQAPAKKALIWQEADDLITQLAKETTDPVTGARVEANVNILKKTFLTEDGKPAVVFIRPASGEIFGAEGVRNVGLAVDIKGASTLIKASGAGQNKLVVTQPIKGFAEENLLRGKSSAMSDLDFLIELKRFDNLKKEEVPHIAIAPDHLPRQNAFLSYLSKLTPEEQASTKVFIRSDYPTYQAQQQFLEKTVRKDYKAKLETISNDQTGHLMTKLGQSAEAGMLADWKGGNLGPLRRAFDSFFRGTSLPATEARNKGVAEQIWSAGKVFRDRLRAEVADADGFVYLYRGIRGSIKGHAPVEGYTTDPSVAAAFGTARIFRVHVDNIIGRIGGRGYAAEKEILVASPHQQIVNNIPYETAQARAVHIPSAETSQAFTVDQFFEFYANETERQVKELIASKIMSVEEISARLNIETHGVQAIMLGAKLSEYPTEWRRYTNATDIDSKYLNLRNKLFAAIGNPAKNPNAEVLANLDNRQLRVAHNEIVSQMTQLSNSEIAIQVANVFQEKDVQLALDSMMNNLAEINIVKVGAAQAALVPQSADQIVRNLKDGPLLTYIGKAVIDNSDKIKKTLLEPLAAKFVPFRDKPELFAEFNTVVNKLRGLQGWRDIRLDEATGYGYIVQKQGTGKGIVEVPLKNADGSVYYIKQSEVLSALDSMRKPASEVLKLHNLIRRITGMPPVNDLGFYVPPLTIANKALAFVIDNTGLEDVKLLTANTQAELETAVNNYKRINSSKVTAGQLDIVKEGERADYNLAKQYTQYESQITYADVTQFHTGSSALAIVPSDARFVNEIMQGFEQQILNGVRRYSETSLTDIMGWLDKLSAYYQGGTAGSPQRGIFKPSVRDPALAVKNILLGRDQLESSVPLKAVNSLVDMLYNRAATGVNSVAKSFAYEKIGSKEFFESLGQTLKAKGIDAPWASFDEYLATTVAETGNIAPRIQSVGNGLLASMNLRIFELAQAAINIMSLPILTWAALMEKLPATQLNPKGQMIKFPMEAMYDGMRFMYSDAGKEIIKKWEEAGHIKQAVRQYTELTATLKAASQGKEFADKALDVLDNIQNSRAVKDFFAKPADWAEEWTRTYAMSTGFLAAKRAYPGIGDTGATIAAVAFADRTVGNYYAAQRPVLFQGTFGAAIGLYQTYILTYAQSIYRSLENKNFKQLGSLALAQSALFGTASWPGYHTLSEQVVGRISDQHIDVTTGTYRAIGDPAARIVLYGLPSSIGPAFYTRGDISPRIPSTMGEIAIFNGIKQGYSAAVEIISKTGEGITTGNATQSMLEALSLQSMNRPIARWSELVTGSSITREYNTMSPSTEVWTPLGVFSRLLGTRSIEEQVTRNAQFLNRYYESMDHDRRAKAVDELTTAIRNDNLSADILDKTAERYFRFGGSSKGFRSVVNETLLKSEEGTRMNMLRTLEADSPLRLMIDDLY